MIPIRKSPTADTRTCDFANTDIGTLLQSSEVHIDDVVRGMAFFAAKLTEQAGWHDRDKLTLIEWFHRDFVTGFKETGWWDNHRKITRHHINAPDGVRDDVNLIDVLEHIVDCVMAGMARAGSVYELKLDDALLQRAFQNTVEMLKREVTVVD
jgi:CBS-domain-containing membrane protein